MSNSEKKQNIYQPKEIENAYYKIWEERNYFEIDGNKNIQKKDKNFALMMPPPNVTGRLHIGHALTFTLQDIITRYKRMDGYKTLWQPGTDHAGIATQNVVEKQILAEGSSKEEYGREKFLNRVWEWKEKSAGIMTDQLRVLGVSPAWKRERFTMDDGLQKGVATAFKKLYDDGMIIRDNYMVNWCTHDGALSDIEVEHQEHKGKFYHINYPITGTNKVLTVATTRPETYFGDTAIMVHPDDPRYTQCVGKTITLPLINRKVKIIADKYVDMNFGTGVVKVTPSHDINDYEIGKRHGLEFITIFDDKGILNHHCGAFEGQDRLKARDSIVNALKGAGFLVKIEDHIHQVGHCYRCNNIVEPYISKQWFLKKEIANKAIEKAQNEKELFFPPHWINSYNSWMGELRDWCISRQLWWGHRIPIFNCNDCGKEYASEHEDGEPCPACTSINYTQDPDVLDTWFSSALWPFSTLGYGNDSIGENTLFNSNDIKDFYPNTLLITGFDILFFWVARMMMMGEHFMGELPFKNIYLHALVRDEHGDKMSKSRGNVIDPINMVNQYSADTLRFTLAILAVQGRDIKLSKEKLELNRNFGNKLYNASRFLLLNHNKFDDLDNIKVITPLGLYMQSRLRGATKEVRLQLDQYRFNDAATTLYRFMWGEFCDWGIELSKANKESISELGSIFKESLKLIHPFIPFLSEHLYHQLSGTELENSSSIMIMRYPENINIDSKIENDFKIIMESIVAIRRAKALVDLNKSIKKVFVKLNNENIDKTLLSSFISKLAKVENVEFVNKKQNNSISDVSDNLEVYIPTDSIDLAPIIKRLKKQEEKLEKEIGKISNMLNNKHFVSNAPKEVIVANENGLALAEQKLLKVKEELSSLQKNS
jgi:valyl-tRNA synthetase